MRRVSSEKMQIWQRHFEAAASFPGGISAYCRSSGIQPSSFYSWRQRANKAKSSPFLPVVVSAAMPVQRQARVLPDAQWVAEVISHVIRGLA